MLINRLTIGFLTQIGSKEKLEQFQNKSMTQIRQDLHDDYKNRLLVQKMQEKLVSDVKVSPVGSTRVL